MIQTFERRGIDSDAMHGVIVAESDDLILLQYANDFEFDGYQVIRRRDVTQTVESPSNSYWTQLMKKEGLWKSPTKAVRKIPVDNWKTVFNALIGTLVIIECERKGDFCIGPIIECDDRAVTVHHFDGIGEWQQIERVPYHSITLVQFDNRYINVHGRHLPPRPQ